ncbi:zinc metalloprotease HtpX [Candidatus Woesearchaeota archaeon]|jgi:heat shock protein HtpX|nr:zinc metalloprotease HtpX [Candidatus Woesearchaeota archaeon]MBT3537454.1 zinc metalloprotease HtpX [Candidatus Woesearchaeota archaeon]MBT4696948.1 zinc metalloprotease HtpX [Candidatus Woesearchaeota archaeon]MBT4717568.1 zinc metalloprotease HtpX [Candidatus Woesearchaeota archaeon]MBT7106236.1 zinc metalloprotease HtpX [Candidatus Woesearchaeota archaeon]
MFQNQIKTVVLLGALSGLLLVVGNLLGGMNGLIIAFVIAIGINFFSYWYSDKLVLKMYKAKPITESQSPKLFAIVKGLSKKAKIPMPKVYIIPTNNPNAFATGRNPEHAAVACTQGILQMLDKDELTGVIAHELSHIKHRDILISSVAATIATVIAFVASMARFAALFGGFGGRDNDNSGFIYIIVLGILTPIIATVLQLAISRSREYLADEGAAKITKKPKALASALQKLESGAKHNPLRFGNPTTSNIFISNPFRAGGMMKLFSTHPPTAERVKRLENLKI